MILGAATSGLTSNCVYEPAHGIVDLSVPNPRSANCLGNGTYRGRCRLRPFRPYPTGRELRIHQVSRPQVTAWCGELYLSLQRPRRSLDPRAQPFRRYSNRPITAIAEAMVKFDLGSTCCSGHLEGNQFSADAKRIEGALFPERHPADWHFPDIVRNLWHCTPTLDGPWRYRNGDHYEDNQRSEGLGTP
jgi:hypothetical protein